MTDIPTVDIGVACSPHQIPDWWSPFASMLLETERSGIIKIGSIRQVSGALPDHNKNNTIGVYKRRWNLTDVNRNEVINEGFLKGGAEWIFWVDDDTVPPQNAITHLLKSGRAFIAGLYFLPKKPFNPIAYKKNYETGLYSPIYRFPEGGLFEVDSVGMGCTLIHRSVYEKIRDEFRVYQRNNGSIWPIHKSQVKPPVIAKHKKRVEAYIRAGVFHEQMIPVDEQDGRNFPYYLLEHGRTEDHHFCELADQVGFKPWIDTLVTCAHWKHQETTVEDYKNELEEADGFF